VLSIYAPAGSAKDRNVFRAEKRKVCCCRIAAAVLALSAAIEARAEMPSVAVSRVTGGPIALDGRLDEPAWRQAGVIDT
jgi:hypothetical protein